MAGYGPVRPRSFAPSCWPVRRPRHSLAAASSSARPGACVAALGTFLPCYLFTVLPAPYFKKYGKLPAVKAFVDGITAAAVGAITGSVIVIARRSIVDWPTIVLALATVLLLWRFKKLQEPVIVVAA